MQPSTLPINTLEAIKISDVIIVPVTMKIVYTKSKQNYCLALDYILIFELNFVMKLQFYHTSL